MNRTPPAYMYIRAGPAKVLTWPLLGYAPLNLRNLDAIFWHGVYHAPTKKWKACPKYIWFFVREILYDRYNDQKNTRATTSCLEKKEGAGVPFVCACGWFKHEVEILRSKLAKIERGIAVMPLGLITTCSIYSNRFFVVIRSYLLMGDELGNETDIDRLLMSSGWSTPSFTLMDDFWSCHTD